MSDILSKISGQFSRSLLLGAVLPAVLFTILGFLFLEPLLPHDLALALAFGRLSNEMKAAALAIWILLLSGTLYSMNIPIIRYFEGYPWENSWWGGRKKTAHKRRFKLVRARRDGLRATVRALSQAGSDSSAAQDLLNRTSEEYNKSWPDKEELVLPTVLGNVLRSFEAYPRRQYGIDSVNMWPRLVAKIDKEYAAVIDESKSTFDFMLNVSLLSAILAAGILVAGLYYLAPFASAAMAWRWLAEGTAFVIIAIAAYRGAVIRAGAWGELVKGAFDLYRGALLEQLGFKERPATQAREKALWGRISRQIIFGDSPNVPLLTYDEKAPRAVAERPLNLELPMERSIRRMGSDRIRVRIRVRAPSELLNLSITDAPPDGFDYEPDTALAGMFRPAITGSNPYSFVIARVKSGETVDLRYDAVSHKAG